MNRKPKSVAQQLLDLEEALVELIDATPNPARRKHLSKLRKAISKAAGRLIDRNLDTATREYKEAAAALGTALESTREAIANVNSAQAAIDNLAAAVQLISNLAVVV